MSKKKFPLNLALRLAEKIVEYLEPHTDRILIAGSIRRKSPQVGDIEILYIPKFKMVADPDDLFGDENKVLVNCVDQALDAKIKAGMIEKRGGWGEKNKLGLHVPTGMPVDFFSTDKLCWDNYLVCRTGPAESNVSIAASAKKMGWLWQPYGRGFLKLDSMGNPDESEGFRPVYKEEDVFTFVGLKFNSPEHRV